jgi:hypothetical protein
MKVEEKYIELRINGSGLPYVAILGKRHPKFVFERLFNNLPRRRERLPDGRKDEIHLLLDADLTYEIVEKKNGRWVTWYAATLEDDCGIHRISRLGAEKRADRLMTVREVVAEYPERALFEVDEFG